MRKLRHGIDRDLSLPCVSLTIAVGVGKRDLLDLQSGKRSLRFPIRQPWRGELFASGLRNDEPSRLMHKAGECVAVVLAFAGLTVVLVIVANLTSDWHAENQS